MIIDADMSAVSRETMVANILGTYDTASDAQRKRGTVWYARMTAIATGHATRLNIPVESVAGVWAAWSINNGWRNNIRQASAMLRGRPYRGLGMSIRKAQACMNGESLTVANPHARKVLAFCANMSGDYERVTVDRHALRIAYGLNEGGYVPEGAEYDSIETAYTLAALMRNVEPAIMQAVTWIAQRGVR